MEKIVFATNNQHKLSEIRSILGDSIDVLSLKDIGCDVDIPETGSTLEENALQKAQYVYDHYHLDCFADDTGLEVEALDGAPGVYSARYASLPDNPLKSEDGEAASHDSEANMTRLLYELQGQDNRRARFRTVIALIQKRQVCPCGCTNIKEVHRFEGIVEGQIISERRGGEGFGYDPVFQPDGYDKTFAELGMEVKNHISHRARAVTKLCEFLSSCRRLWIGLLLIICFSCFSFSPTRAQVGSWRNYMAYHEIQNICKAGDDLFVLASNDLYQYSQSDQSITTYDKTNALNDVRITHIAWNPQARRLIAVYENSNIDLIDVKGNVTNISGLYTKSMTEDKSVSRITIDGLFAWLHCGFGYVKVNMQRAEIADTYTPNHPEYPSSLPAYDEYQDLDDNLALVSTLSPGGPSYNCFYESKFINGKLYTTGGFFLSSIPDPRYPGIVQVYDGDDWQVYEEHIGQKTGYEYLDINCIDVDPTDENHVFAGGKCGLYEFKNGSLVQYYNRDNSPLGGAYSGGKELGNNYVLVHSVKFDAEGNLWVFNSQTKNVNILRLTKDGTWEDHFQQQLTDDESVGLPGLRSAYYDTKGIICLVNSSHVNPCFIQFNPETDEVVKYNNFTNQDGTKYGVHFVNCSCEDKEGNIWIGTSSGLFYIDKNDIGQSDAVYRQVKVPRNDGTNYADYLLSGVDVSHIAIDGGNRKWISTTGAGMFLISADNMTQIHNFTKDNSKLLSDNVYSSAINQQTGEVFFLTDKGICSYLSDATEPAEEASDSQVYAYPNPVTPDYTGLISIVGLNYDSDVKIVSANGALIAEGRSNGGMFTWDGKDRNGRSVASGIYMAISATNEGKKGVVCKIAIIR